MMKHRCIVLVLAFFAVVPVCLASNQVVSDCGDSGGANQFRAKLNDAQNTGGGTITFTCGPAEIALTQGLLSDIRTNTTIAGGGTITISGNDAIRIFIVRSGVTLTLKNITLTKGYANGDGGAVFNNGTLNVTGCKFLYNQTIPSFSGGAIVSYGPLSITNSEFGFNKGGGGGAVYPRWGNAVTTITGSNFHDNEATNTSDAGNGGAILLWDGPSATISSTTFDNNKAKLEGGAIHVTANSIATLNNKVTFRGNSAEFAGGIYNHGTTYLSNATFTGNSAPDYGGAILNWGGTLNLATVTFTANSGYNGGAINNYLGNATLTNVMLSGNSAHTGGGISKHSGTANLTNVTVSGNFTVGGNCTDCTDPDFGGDGGGIFNYYDTANLTNVTVSGNSSTYSGGGIFNYPGTANLTNVTVSGNSATMYGGGIFHAGTATLINVTLAGNSAPSGGGIYSSNSSLTARNTLINKGANGTNCAGFYLGGSNNLSNDNTCGFGAGDNVKNLLLGPLANNGGFTKTHLPSYFPKSAAIDAGDSFAAPSTDQRGVSRPQPPDGLIDIGAVEVVPLVENEHPFIQYDGWRGYTNGAPNGGSYRMSNITNDTATYNFTNTSIKWITRKAPTMGKALVTVDGANASTVDLYYPNALWNQQFLFGGLTNALHQIAIKVTGTKNASATDFNVAVDGFLVGTSTTPVQETALGIQYNNWVGVAQNAASGKSYRINDNLGSVARFRFSGTSINFITARGPSYGKVNVLIDGVAVSSNLDLYAAAQQWRYAISYSSLADTNHLLEIRPTHTKNASSTGYRVVVDAFTGPFTALP